MHREADGPNKEPRLGQNGGGLADASRTAQILCAPQRGIADGAELNEFGLAGERVHYGLKTLLRPLLIPDRMAATHAAALDDDPVASPGGSAPLFLADREIWPYRYRPGDPDIGAELSDDMARRGTTPILVKERRIVGPLELGAPKPCHALAYGHCEIVGRIALPHGTNVGVVVIADEQRGMVGNHE